MFNGIERVMARMSEIEERISLVAGGPPAGGPAGSFAEALNSAQEPASGEAPGSPALPPLPVAPDARFLQPLPTATGSASLPSPGQIDALAQQSGTKYGLDPNLLSAVIHVESGGDPHAVSRTGAMGLMQLMPSSVADADVSDPFDPAQNVDAGARKLSGLLGEFGGNLDLALAAYNAGAGAVRKYGGVPPYKETQDYIRKVHKQMGAE
ncbi:MAG TPA: lytic transglycosylase domain-containing protein [Capsulimonadaceae bacterium]|nr:lytic transglycosylase domain-containing protein [Capsulimonadaceae bacterium]